MSTNVAGLFGELGNVLGVCPECDCLFYLSETRPYLSGMRPRSVLDALRAAERKLDRVEEELNAAESALREQAAKTGLRTAKRLLKKIDPLFSGAGYDPQDVRVIFNPVTYVVFDGLARGSMRKILLLANPPEDKRTENLHRSIDRAIERGDVEFQTLHVDREGRVLAK